MGTEGRDPYGPQESISTTAGPPTVVAEEVKGQCLKFLLLDSGQNVSSSLQVIWSAMDSAVQFILTRWILEAVHA